ncbi:peptide/nickel transport system permease protein [Roseovarius halotolerans]|uniref:Dipeptide transport system permease protein DppC n=1 Tax=Roseovarius halotolerans TaxID=505353 RepID=A0A1X6ZHH8_9RHOB|nr:ABC transporter permease [Roseovarius halotolerans]RKT30887.1 peptide/nickel transport system permease protein [Roseovarius halotolerans]SLN51035.1 Dipeptide transport system permease protein DppC [Roseovarius halotolerans]
MISFKGFLRRFLSDPVAIGAGLVLLVLVLMAVLAPFLAPQDPYDLMQLDIMDSELPPSWKPGGDERFWLGTDAQGRGVFSTIMYGTGISLLIGIGAVIVQAVLGVTLGLIAGYKGGWIDSFLMRLADIQLSLSTLMMAIIALALFQAAFDANIYADYAIVMLIMVIGIAEWPKFARTVRSSVLGERKKEYVDAARVIGLPPRKIMWGHILPNTLTPVLVISTIQVAEAIMIEASLSFLGLGMPVDRPSLGSLIRSGFEFIFSGSWWITLYPAIVLVALILALNLLGDWLRDVLNPKLRRGED